MLIINTLILEFFSQTLMKFKIYSKDIKMDHFYSIYRKGPNSLNISGTLKGRNKPAPFLDKSHKQVAKGTKTHHYILFFYFDWLFPLIVGKHFYVYKTNT
jgi:hypothetical protein